MTDMNVDKSEDNVDDGMDTVGRDPEILRELWMKHVHRLHEDLMTAMDIMTDLMYPPEDEKDQKDVPIIPVPVPVPLPPSIDLEEDARGFGVEVTAELGSGSGSESSIPEESVITIDPNNMTGAERDLISFMTYMKSHPDQRFWEALRNWSGWTFLWVSSSQESLERADRGERGGSLHDTFYWESTRRPPVFHDPIVRLPTSPPSSDTRPGYPVDPDWGDGEVSRRS